MDKDQPIASDELDRFHRVPLADAIGADLTDAVAGDGVVAALVGPWGSGKTSLLNLVKARVSSGEDVVVIDFNPWYFSGTAQLVEHFLADISGQLASRGDRLLKSIADRLDAYRQVLEPVSAIPVVGAVAEAAAAASAAGGEVARRQARFGSGSIATERAAIEKALRDSGKRFLVVLDDIDRLQPQEVRDIVRLVRLVADFPGISYLLAFDRQRVENILGDGDEQLGRDYLEKIVQVVYLLPAPTRGELAGYAFAAVDAAIAGLETRELDERYWGNVQALVVTPLIRTPRDAKRFANALPATIRAVGLEVNLADVLALEAVRVLLPDIFDELPRLADALTHVDSGFYGLGGPPDETATYQKALETLIARAGDRGASVRELLRLVFPGSQAYTGNTHHGPEWNRTWRRERRVASLEVFAVYLARTVPAGSVPSGALDIVAGNLSNAEVLEAALGAIPDALLEPILERLEDYEDSFPAEPLEAIVAVANLRPRLRVGRAGMFDWGADAHIERLILRLLRRVEPEERRGEITLQAYGRVSTLTGRLWLALLVGNRENVGQGLVSVETQAALEARLRGNIVAVRPEDLATERDLVRLVDFVKREGGAAAQSELARLLASDAVLLGLLRSSLSETRSQTIGEVTVQTESVLPWEWLETLVAPDDLLGRVTAIDASTIDPADRRLTGAVATAKRYAEGWRPESDARMRSAGTTGSQTALDDDGAKLAGHDPIDAAEPPGQNLGLPDKS